MRSVHKLPTVTSEPFGLTTDGRPGKLFTLANSNGLVLKISEYGATITDLQVPDRDGNIERIVLGFDTLAEYLVDRNYFGATLGRYAGRIAGGQFVLDGNVCQLSIGRDGNHLHGGVEGFDSVVWKGEASTSADKAELTLRMISPAGDQGYPGRLEATVTFSLSNDDVLAVDYRATSDAPTVVNLTNHSYFNLSGDGHESVLDHVLMIDSGNYLVLDENLIPTGEISATKDTPFDFRDARLVGACIDEGSTQLAVAGGYDHTWVLGSSMADEPKPAATLYHPGSGREMRVWTTEPGIHIYSANSIGEKLIGAGGASYSRNHGICFETQHFPNSPNNVNFPSTRLDKGNVFRSRTTFEFSARASSKHFGHRS
ncbi:MAG: galactose-1-epimerase [Woeseiaceae bacterium]|nr:galactose-1-epimerase [Woeseiaceae bacterium]